MNEQAEPVRSPLSGPDSHQTSGPPPQPRPVQQSGSRGRVRHGNGASDKQREDQDTSSHTFEEAEAVRRYVTSEAGYTNVPARVGIRCIVKGATPTQQPEPYWRSRADTAAKIQNPLYASNAGTIPMKQPQSLRSRANCAAEIPNPTYASTAGEPLSYWRSLANAAAKIFSPLRASSSDDPPMDQPQTDNQARANDDENTPDVTYATIPDSAYPGEASGRRGVCSFLRARRSCLAAGIAVLLGLVAVGLAPLTFSNKQEISQLSTTVKRDMRQLSTTVDALKRDNDDIRRLSLALDALKRDQDDMSTTVDVLKRDQDDMGQMSATVDTLKRDQDALKRDQDALKREQDALKREQDALKRDLDYGRNGTAALEQRLHEIVKTLRYTMWRGTCYKAFNTRKTFSEAAAACRADGGTLAMPRDAETDAFLTSLYKSVSDDRCFWSRLHGQREEAFWFGLQRVEGRFEWVDGSTLGPYNSWGPGQPNNHGNEDCVVYFKSQNKWHDYVCNNDMHRQQAGVSPLLYSDFLTIRSQTSLCNAKSAVRGFSGPSPHSVAGWMLGGRQPLSNLIRLQSN
ncbi:Fibrinogen C domain-containing protein 1 [Branchiostoma belcheri]|nr:Fibrinogen C domain-containing protein 1 [Branchiostoma belcheri]